MCSCCVEHLCGEDGGAVAADGTVESGINLAIAQDLDALLRFLGCETRMTRTEDAAIYSDGARTLREKKASDLKNRVALVNETPNAVLLSIHQNSLPASRRVHGAQAFHARTEGSEALAESVQVALNAAVNPGNEKSRKVIDKSVYLMKNISCPAVGRVRLSLQRGGGRKALRDGLSAQAGCDRRRRLSRGTRRWASGSIRNRKGETP